MLNKPQHGGKREGSGRKPEGKIRLPSPYVLPSTSKTIKHLKNKTKKTFGELLDERFA